MILNFLGVVSGAIVGIGIPSTALSGSEAWRFSSILVAVGFLLGSIVGMREELRDHRRGMRGPYRRLSPLAWGIFGVSIGLHLANASGLAGTPSFSLFFFGLVALLALAGVQFVVLVYQCSQSRPPSQAARHSARSQIPCIFSRLTPASGPGHDPPCEADPPLRSVGRFQLSTPPRPLRVWHILADMNADGGVGQPDYSLHISCFGGRRGP